MKNFLKTIFNVQHSIFSVRKGFTPHYFSRKKLGQTNTTKSGEGGLPRTTFRESKSGAGFTLLELLIVIGIIAVLMTVAIVAINPARQLAKANNVGRMHDLNQIASAIQQNIIDNKGPFYCAAGPIIDCSDGTQIMGSDTAAGQYDICDCLVSLYLPQMPVDPQFGSWDPAVGCTTYDTQYEICSASLILGAPHAQLTAEFGEISVTMPGDITVITPPAAPDTTPPTVGTTSPTSATVNVAATFSASVSDNVEVTSCSLFVNGLNQGPMNLSASPCINCTASRDHTFTLEGTFPMYASCSDAAGNSTDGSSVDVTVTSPVTEVPIWQSCETGSLSCGNTSDSSWGYKFTPTQSGQVTGLCGFFSGTKRLRLYDSTYSDLLLPNEVWITSPDNWVCESITPAVNITAGSTYYVVTEVAGSGGCFKWGFSLLPQTCNTVTIDAGVFQSPSGTFDASHGETTIVVYGMTDILFSP